MMVLGVDPDTLNTAFATWDGSGPGKVWVAHVKRTKARTIAHTAVAVRQLQREIPSVDVVAIEGQQIDGRRTGKGDLFTLAHVTGICIAECSRRHQHAEILVPIPFEWKKSVAKHAMQARLYDSLGWGYEIRGKKTARSDNRWSVPVHAPSKFQHVTDTQWKHVGDALLLARWAHDQNS